MESQPRPELHVVNRRTSPSLILCLLALLTYFVLASLHGGHSIRPFLPDSYAGQETAPAVLVSHSGRPPTAGDSPNCPVCQADSDFPDYGLLSLPQVPDRDSTLQVAFSFRLIRFFADHDLSVAGTRAPPPSV
jgi:hypothetical protein